MQNVEIYIAFKHFKVLWMLNQEFNEHSYFVKKNKISTNILK